MSPRKPAAAPAAEPQTAVAPAPTPAGRTGFFRRLSPLGKVISALVATISFVTGIIAVVPIFTRDTTNFGSLRIEAAEMGGTLEFAVPVTADFASFPTGGAGACDSKQQAWLESQGIPIHTTYLIDLHNVASDGPMLALNDFRGTGESSSETPLVKVLCDPTGGSPDNLQAARLMVSDETQVAYFDKSAYGQSGEGIPDSPVVWNLAPGETGQIVLVLFPTAGFTGTLGLTAVSGTEQKPFIIPVGKSDEISVPGLVRGGIAYLQVDGGLNCLRIEGAERMPCDISDLIGTQ